MRGVIVHAILLVTMLAFGFQTWTRDKSVPPITGEVVVWSQLESALQTIELVAADQTLRLEHRGQGAGAYWWGIETRTTRNHEAPQPPQVAEGDTTTNREFPIGGEIADNAIQGLAELRAIRSLGVLTEEQKKDYELNDASKNGKVSIVSSAGTQTLILGRRIFHSAENYVLDQATGQGYVVHASVPTPLKDGERMLRMTTFRPLQAKDAVEVEIAAGGKTKVVRRIKVARPDDGRTQGQSRRFGEPETIETWGTGQTVDTAAANFIDKIEKLAPKTFDSHVDPASLGQVVTLTYRDARGKSLGTIQLLERAQPGAAATGVEYLLLTERTHVPGVVDADAAARVVPDIATILGE